MTTKETLLLVFALIWIAVVVFLLAQWMRTPVAAVKAVGGVEVLTAATDIAVGKPLMDAQVTWKEIPETQVEATDLKRGANYTGRTVLTALQKGQIIKSNYLAPVQPARMAQLIGSGSYAMTVNIGKNQDENIFIVPGDKVDVFLTRPITNTFPAVQKTGFVTQRILVNVRVLAVNNVMTQGSLPVMKPSNLDQKTLTLEVNAKQAERLALGTAMGTLSFGLYAVSGMKTKASMSSVYSESLEPSPSVEYHGDKVIVK